MPVCCHRFLMAAVTKASIRVTVRIASAAVTASIRVTVPIALAEATASIRGTVPILPAASAVYKQVAVSIHEPVEPDAVVCRSLAEYMSCLYYRGRFPDLFPEFRQFAAVSLDAIQILYFADAHR
jgi:hypothetical protein